MQKSRLEWKVGIFVLISIAALIGLIVQFSKGGTWFEKRKTILMETSNVGGIIPGASVAMAGVPIGQVSRISLTKGGKMVQIHLSISPNIDIYEDARFTIRQSGFLGDRYVAVIPQENKGKVLQNGAIVQGDSGFDLEDVAQSAAGLVKKVDEAAQSLNRALVRLEVDFLSSETLTNFAGTVSNFRQASEKVLTTLNSVDQFVRTNSQPLNTSVSNLVAFSTDLKSVAAELHETISTNRDDIRSAIKNIESASERVDKLVGGLQSGKGLAGSLLHDDQVQQEFRATLQNLSMLSSNLNKHGLFWKPRVRRESSAVPYTGKNPHAD